MKAEELAGSLLARTLLMSEEAPGGLVVASVQPSNTLLESRNRTVAKSFYRQLRNEGFSHEQIIQLSTTLLDLVTEDMKPSSSQA